MAYLWDPQKNAVRWQQHLIRSGGICSVSYARGPSSPSLRGRLLVATVEDHISLIPLKLLSDFTQGRQREVKWHSMEAKKTEKGHDQDNTTTTTTIWGGHFCPHNSELFMTTGGNGTLDLFRTINGDHDSITVERASKSSMSDGPIVSFDWNEHKEGLFAFVSLDNTVQAGFISAPLSQQP